ncbi:DUF4352 domain-containing protein [Vagococcus penaei]|uniref:DUF4352 domain-containing protein n=1 Tax=Vagococcus penaei TaxID=633807 RepID=A0A1Q2D7Z8_9ENTE|nr:DUF4352 domain-containing protein [Vagococcus penaei]AQP54534.1 hypothetical protein BW732_10175 [Vagococcus penaei]
MRAKKSTKSYQVKKTRYLKIPYLKDRKGVIYLQKRAFYLNIWFGLFLLTFIAFLITLSLLRTSLITNHSLKNKEQTTNLTATKQQKVTANKTLQLTESGRAGDLELTVNSVKSESEIKEGNFKTYQSENGIFALINVSLKNTGHSTATINVNDFKLVTDEKKEYMPSILAGLTTKYITFESMNPDLTVSGFLVFEIPKTIDLANADLYFTYDGTLLTSHLKKSN